MRLNQSLLLLCFVSTALSAGEAKLYGQSQVESGPDYVSLHIQVKSQCYKDPSDATKETDKVAAEVVKYLTEKIGKPSEYNKVITEGGYISDYGRYSRACQGTFEKSTTITLNTTNISGFGELFNDLQQMVNSKFKFDPYKSKDVPVTFVAVATPHPVLSFETEQNLEKKALKLALANAEAKLKASFEGRQLKDLVIKDMSEIKPKFEPNPPRYELAMRKADLASALTGENQNAPAPIMFDVNKISKTIQVTFGYSDINISDSR